MGKVLFLGLEVLAVFWVMLCYMGAVFAVPGNPSPEQVSQLRWLGFVIWPGFFLIVPGLLIAAGILRFLSPGKIAWLLLSLAALLPPVFVFLAVRILAR